MVRELAMPEPILLVEVLSPSDKAATRSNVWAFSTLPSLREIPVVDSTKVGAQIVGRAADGTWPQALVTVGAHDKMTLDSIGLSCAVADLYTGTHLVRAGDG